MTSRLRSALWTTVGLLATLASWFLLTAPSAPGSPAHARPADASQAGAPSAAASPAEPAAGGPSLYVLSHSWTDQSGQTLSLTDLAGRPRVMAMVYTHCSHACPMIMARMMQLEAEFAHLDAAAAPGMVLISIDPLRDTPERLADFATSAGLDPERWTLLTGNADAVLELSVLLDVKYQAGPDGTFSHSNVLTVLDGEGRRAARVEGLTSDLGPALSALRALADTP